MHAQTFEACQFILHNDSRLAYKQHLSDMESTHALTCRLILAFTFFLLISITTDGSAVTPFCLCKTYLSLPWMERSNQIPLRHQHPMLTYGFHGNRSPKTTMSGWSLAELISSILLFDLQKTTKLLSRLLLDTNNY